MGTDAIIVCRSKKIYCDIDREDNFRYNGKDDEFQEVGITPVQAIEIGQLNLHGRMKVNQYQIMKGIKFLQTLGEDDIVQLLDDVNDFDEQAEIEYGPNWNTDEDEGPIERNDKSESEYKEWDEYSIEQWEREFPHLV